MRSWPAF